MNSLAAFLWEDICRNPSYSQIISLNPTKYHEVLHALSQSSYWHYLTHYLTPWLPICLDNKWQGSKKVTCHLSLDFAATICTFLYCTTEKKIIKSSMPNELLIRNWWFIILFWIGVNAVGPFAWISLFWGRNWIDFKEVYQLPLTSCPTIKPEFNFLGMAYR